jgi:biopolymer transport protein ExbD
MKHLLEVCLVALALAGSTHLAVAQSAAEVPKQRGISVDLPVTSNAVAVPDADKKDALVVTVTYDGSLYIGVDQIEASALPEKIRNVLSDRDEKTLYIKADARSPYMSFVRILDSARTAEVQRVTLLTAQPGSEEPRALVPPKGLEVLLASSR